MKNFLKLSLIALFSTLLVNCSAVSMTGLVYDATTGEPVTGYSMTITAGADVFDSADAQAQDITINDDGTYEIGAAALETMRGIDIVMTITADGYVTSKVTKQGLVTGDAQVSDHNVVNVKLYPVAAKDVVIKVVNTTGTALQGAKVKLTPNAAASNFSTVVVVDPDTGAGEAGDVTNFKEALTDASGNATFTAATLINNYTYTYSATMAGYVTKSVSDNVNNTSGSLTLPEISDITAYTIIMKAEDPYAPLAMLSQSNRDYTNTANTAILAGSSVTFIFSHNVKASDNNAMGNTLQALIGAVAYTDVDQDGVGNMTYATNYTAAVAATAVASGYSVSSSGNTVTVSLTGSSIYSSTLDGADYYAFTLTQLYNKIGIQKAGADATASGTVFNGGTSGAGDNNGGLLSGYTASDLMVLQYGDYPACTTAITTNCNPTLK